MLFLKKSICFLCLFFFQYYYSQNDCVDAVVACGNVSYNNLSVLGPGNSEINNNNSCSGQETNTLWIKVNIKTAGTLGFILTPENTNISVDFDFYVFGPNSTCGNLGTTIRCSTTNPQLANSSNNTTGMNASETDAFEGPGQSGNNFVSSLDVLVGETYYFVIDRFGGDSNFSLQWTGTATFNEPPTINNTTAGATLNMEKCDTDAVLDDSTPFNLYQNGTLAIGNQPNIVATFYTTENDAIVAINPILIPSNYNNTSNPQSIYIRLENTITNCFSTSSFSLTVTPFQTANPIDLSECDNNNNGFETFNLSLNDAVLINGNPDIEVTYHPAANDNITLPVNYTNQVANTNETLWVKIKDKINGCVIFKPFNIIINTTPSVFSTQLTQCDFEIFPDGLTTFNLLEATNAITNNNVNFLVKFYANTSDATNDTNSLNTNYSNISNPQTLFVRVINPTTNCFSTTQLVLNVSTNPTSIVTLNECDDDGTEDGITTFNLANAGFGSTGTTVSYYYNLNDALLEQNKITNTTFGSQTIYARVENGNDCIGLHIINLVVQGLPVFTIETKGTLCLNMPNQLVTLNTIITNPANYNYLWTPNGETTQNIIVSNPGNYAVTVSNILNSCNKTVSSLVISSASATVLLPTIIDLEGINSVLISVSGIGNYVYNLDNPFGIYQASPYFENVPNGLHTVYIKDLNGCGIVEDEISVIGAPNYFTPNGDGINDTWNISGVNEQFYSNSIIFIYNRFGKLIKEIAAIGKGWDGMYNGNFAPSDDYWFTIKLDDGRSTKGHFSLKR
ncbi:T9SS type B sorting domain-containing protein [Flavobacterium sp.]|uniref:T9SS type B sorting domain-containing protein n=1 Tax=Flavobacterium sp. TaxID=239 RepID=UPI0037537389